MIKEKKGYQRLLVKLIYLTITRPDISYAVSLVSQYMHAPRSDHLAAVHRILKYLKGSPGQGILYKSHGHIRAEEKSTTGYCTMVGGNLVSWKSKKQAVTAKSSAKAEYRAVANGCCELM